MLLICSVNRERIEEVLLVALALITLTYIPVEGRLFQIIITLILSVGLIALLMLRNIDWRIQGSGPFDWVLVSGVLLSLVHLVSFHAFEQTILSGIVVAMFAFFYLFMAGVLFRHRAWWF